MADNPPPPPDVVSADRELPYTCPCCKALQRRCVSGHFAIYECNRQFVVDFTPGGLGPQTDACRIREMEHQLAEVTRERDLLRTTARSAFNSVELEWVRLHECQRRQDLSQLLVEMHELQLSRNP